MSSRSLSLKVGRLPLSGRAREKLICAIRMTARKQGLSRRVTDRYQAWASAFLCWCLGSPERPVDAGQIEPFRRALRQAGREAEEVEEAMDALAFLFGAVRVSELLSTELPGRRPLGIRSGDGDKRAMERANERPHTLKVGWHDKEQVLTAFSCDRSFWDYVDGPLHESARRADQSETGEPCPGN